MPETGKYPPQIGRLEQVDIRSCWEREDTDFTPWLASETNLALLGEAIGVELELVGMEQNVGPFRADILCRDANTTEWVLIENQLEKTDHTHLGQIITYAAGLHATTIIWVARQFTDEHRAAIDWLNEFTTQDLKFFALEIQLWRIGDSPVAPRFDAICRPNNYSKTVVAHRDSRTEETFRVKFWREFVTRLAQDPGPLRPRTPVDANWIGYGIGKTGFMVSVVLNARDRWLRVELYLGGTNAKTNFLALLAHRAYRSTTWHTRLAGTAWQTGLPDCHDEIRMRSARRKRLARSTYLVNREGKGLPQGVRANYTSGALGHPRSGR